MWEPKGKRIDNKALGSLAPQEILFEYEEPLTFVAEDPEGHLLLAHCVGGDRGVSRYLVAASSRTITEDLKAGRSDVLGALRQPRCWIADIGSSGAVESLWAVDFELVPKNVLPRPGSMLTPALQSLFRVRLIGEGVGLGRTSAADVRMAAQAAETSLKTLAEITLKQRKQSGRPTRQIRYYSDLPVQYLGAASFEISCAPRTRPRSSIWIRKYSRRWGPISTRRSRLSETEMPRARFQDWTKISRPDSSRR